MQTHGEWKVLPHGPIEELSERVWRIEGSLPDMPLRRVMTVVRLENGELLIHNGIAADQETMQCIERWGQPRWLLVPNGWHRLDAPAYKARYRDLKVLCPPGARRKVGDVVEVGGTYADFPSTEEVKLETFEGTAGREGVVLVRDRDGTTLIVNDLIFNQPHLPGLFGFIYKLLGQSGAPKVTFLTRLFIIKNRRAVAAHLRRLAGEPELRRIILSHLHPIGERPSDVLNALAETLE